MTPRWVLRGRALLCCALLFGCGGNESDPVVVAPAGCAPGEWLRDDGVCVPAGLPPDMPCPPGEQLREADGLCIPAGVPPDGCGEGFVHDGDRGCEPLLPADPCPDGLMAVPGETSCGEVAPCAPGTWGGIPIEPDTQHVDASYTGGASDGSAAAPWTTIQAGIDAALPGAIVAVAAGSYAEDVLIKGKAVRLWGRCPALVELAATGAALAALFIREGASGAEVRRLAITGQAIGVLLTGAENVLAEELWLHDSASKGIVVQDSLGPTSLSLRGSLLERNHEVGVVVSSSDVSVEATVVRDTLPSAQGIFGRGINVQDDTAGVRANVVVRSSLLERNHGAGVFVAGSDAWLEAIVVRDTLLDKQGFFGRGLNAQDNSATGSRANVVVTGSVFERNHEVGLRITGSDALVEATVVRDTFPDALSLGGHGIVADDDSPTGARANVIVKTSLVERNHEIGVYIAGSDVSLEATVVRDTFPDAQGFFGRAFHVQRGNQSGAEASARLRASLFERSREGGIALLGPVATEIEACIVRDTVPNHLGAFGDGVIVWAQDGPASATVTATVIERSNRAAVSSFGGAVAIESSLLVCQGIDIGSEPWQGQDSSLDDRGGVVCGCPEATERCLAKSYALEPPPPVGGIE